MTTLEQKLKDADISYYRLAKDMGYGPSKMAGHLKRIMSGQRSMSMDMLQEVLNIISKKTKTIVCEDDIKMYVERVRMK